MVAFCSEGRRYCIRAVRGLMLAEAGIMWARVVNQLRWSFRKNWPDVAGFLARRYPEFVLAADPPRLRDEIPVFVFHSVEPERFRAQLEFLKENGYRALAGDELLAVLRGEQPAPANSVVLTFDDGTATLYTVAFPLLQKYDFRAVAFLIPGCVPEEAPSPPDFASYQAGRIDARALTERERSSHPLCSWQEIQEMHRSGVVDFQAHTMYHHLIHVAPRLVDFLNPDYDAYFYANIHVPVYYHGGEPNYSREEPWGTPVYRAEPRFSGRRQYFDREEVRQACVDFVREAGGERFFQQPRWRRELSRFHRAQRRRYGDGRFESKEEMYRALLGDLRSCRDAIEQRLDGKRVRHFCFPWFIGSEPAVQAAQEAGYEALYWGLRRELRINRPGSNPLYIVRLEDRFLFRLPGEGRRSLRDILQEKLTRNLPLWKSRIRGKATVAQHALEP